MGRRTLFRLSIAGLLSAGAMLGSAGSSFASISDPLYHARQITCGKHVSGAFICMTMNYRGGTINGYPIVALENYRIYVKGHPTGLHDARLGGYAYGNRTKRGPYQSPHIVKPFGTGGVPILRHGYTFAPSWRNYLLEVGTSAGGEQCGAAEVDTTAGELYDQNCMVGTTAQPTPPLPGM